MFLRKKGERASTVHSRVRLRTQQSKQKEWNRARDVAATHEGGLVYTRRVGRVRGRLER
jgi:hypothetical protein